jgi:uncharacterized protein YcnI
MSTNRFTAKALAVGAGSAALLTITATGASAHVHADTPNGAHKGGYAVVSIRVPNEEDAAKTTKIEVDFPKDHPISDVTTKPVPGWTAKIDKTKLPKPVKEGKVTVDEAITKITYTAATGGGVDVNQFQTFDMSVGPLPVDTNEIAFPALQTYSNGKVVSWTDPTVPGKPEPEHPAPVVKLAAEEPEDGAAAAPASDSTGAGTGTAAPAGQDDTARWLGGGGLLVGALGLGIGGGALLRSRKATSSK